MSKILTFLKAPIAAILNLIHLNTPARIVVALSPIFVAASGLLTTLAVKYVPGHPHFSTADLRDLFITGSTVAAAKLLLWLHGSQKAEAATSAEKVAKIACEHHIGSLVPGNSRSIYPGISNTISTPGPAGVTGPAGRPPTALELDEAVKRHFDTNAPLASTTVFEDQSVAAHSVGAEAIALAPVAAEAEATVEIESPGFHDVGTVE